MKQKIIASVISVVCLFSLYSYYSYNKARVSELKKEVQTYKEKYNSAQILIEEMNQFSIRQAELVQELTEKNKETTETAKKYNDFVKNLPESGDPNFIKEINEKTNQLFMEFQ